MSLAACLAALADQGLHREHYQVIVVVDGAGKPAPDVVAELGERLQLTVVEQAPVGSAAARNHGAMLARGNLLAFTDDDCRPDPMWLPQVQVAAVQNPGCARFWCRTATVYSHNSEVIGCHAIVQATEDSRERKRRSRQRGLTEVPTCNLSIRRSVFERFGPFPEGISCSDTALHWRLVGAGREVRFTPSARVTHLGVEGWRQLLRHERFH